MSMFFKSPHHYYKCRWTHDRERSSSVKEQESGAEDVNYVYSSNFVMKDGEVPITHRDNHMDLTDTSDDEAMDQSSITSLDKLLQQNTSKHRTDKYHVVKKSQPNLVVRRGQIFKIKITFPTVYTPAQLASVSFVIVKKDVENPEAIKGALHNFDLSLTKTVSLTDWTAYVVSNEDKTVTVGLTAPANSLTGKFRLKIGFKHDKGTWTHSGKVVNMYILFNPWCKDDEVYMNDNNSLNEYILEETGVVYVNECNGEEKEGGLPWGYSQFERNVLWYSFYILEQFKKIDIAKMGSAVHICRTLATLGSHLKSKRVLVGRWDESYGDGIRPQRWNNSREVLDSFWKKKSGVKYGQCWVFAGLLTTIARAIGIPSRVISANSVGRDTKNNMTIDIVLNKEGESMDDLSEDFVWNFHVWNECWMKRTDLQEPEYDGWQHIDSTPLFISNGEYAIGPASVNAIKNGDVESPYDATFIVSEINGDRLVWRYLGERIPLKLIKIDLSSVGHCISTKAIGSWNREDVTNTYKYPENTTSEREALRKALSRSGIPKADLYLNKRVKKLNMGLSSDPSSIIIGQPFDIIVSSNADKDDQTILNKRTDVHLRIEFVSSLRKSLKRTLIFKIQKFAELNPGYVELFRSTITYSMYKDKIGTMGNFICSLYSLMAVNENESYVELQVGVRPPALKMGNRPVMDAIEVSFKNPLPQPISGSFEVTGPDLKIKMDVTNIAAAKLAHMTFFARRPDSETSQTYIAHFISSGLEGLKGSIRWNGTAWTKVAVKE